MKKLEEIELIDVQNERPENEIELEKVGIESLKKFVMIKRPSKTYHIIATINSYITLPSNLRGAHMSRFIESINDIPAEANSIEELAEIISKNALKRHKLDCYTEVSSDLPFERVRPNGEKESAIARMFARFSTRNNKKSVGVSVTGVLACPCAKEICGGLTHNQRGVLTVEIDTSENSAELLDIVGMGMQSFSAPTFSLLKRPEEKEIVEKIHRNPKFVEDVVRDCVQLLREKYLGRYCRVKCVSFESIHDHDVCSEWNGVL
jgi:GTP cyclohydrolase FolE2